MALREGTGGSMKVIITFLLMFLYVICLSSYGVEARMKGLSKEEDMELERQLKILNKPPFKTFRTEEGDIIDCIDIYKQPAFDNPLLKNHKIQMRPSFIPERVSYEDSSAEKHIQIGFKGEECPSGTVPIHRTRKEDLVRAKSFSREFFQRKDRLPGHYLVDLKVENVPKLGLLHGASANINVYNPTVAREQYSNAQIWIENGPIETINNIQAGWTVNPNLYGDNSTRLFSYWTSDGFKTGCYNTLCSGFVQVDKSLTPRAPINSVSTYGGDQFVMKVSVYQDHETGNWWLIATDKDVRIGYWPKSIFTHLADGAGDVVWGGLTAAGPDGVSPPMGSGHFPDGDYTHSCFFEHMEILDELWGTGHLPNDLKKTVDRPNCYDIKYMGYDERTTGSSAMFGGPGGKC